MNINRKRAIESVANAIWHFPNERYQDLNDYDVALALATDALAGLPPVDPERQLTTQESNYVTDRLMELMGTEVGKEYTDELLIAMLCIQINELEGELATERETTKMSSICDHCATVGCIFQTGIKREKCAFYKNKDDLFCKSQLITCKR